MTVALDQHLRQAGRDHCPLWVDAWAYGRHVLRRDAAAPWDDVGALVAHHRQLQGLVKSDVQNIDVGDFYQAWISNHPALLAAMGEKRRLGYALRTLLADGASRAQLKEIVAAICECYGQQPVVLALPSPRAWIGRAHCQARGLEQVEVTWEDAESAAMYMADFVRTFSDCSLSGLLLLDEAPDGPACAEDLLRYQPLFNVAQHYRWQVAVVGCSEGYQPEPGKEVSQVILERVHSGAGATPGRDFWQTGDPGTRATPAFWYVEVPATAVPETVLDRLDTLRQCST